MVYRGCGRTGQNRADEQAAYNGINVYEEGKSIAGSFRQSLYIVSVKETVEKNCVLVCTKLICYVWRKVTTLGKFHIYGPFTEDLKEEREL